MPIKVQEANLLRDRGELIPFLKENLSDAVDGCRFDWLYLGNPCGTARAWIAQDSGKLIGTAAAFPRYFWTGREQKRVWVLGDFCVTKSYRSLGPALLLQRTSLASLGTTIWYDFPGQSMLPIYRRLAIPPFGRHLRFAKLLRTDETIHRLVPHKVLADMLVPLGNWALTLTKPARDIDKGLTFATHESEFGDEFGVLDSMNSVVHPVRAVRTAQYLNWRYLQHPLNLYLVITARRASQLVGYAVFEIQGHEATLADLRTIDPELTTAGMLRYAEGSLSNMNVYKINACLLEDCYLIPHLRRARFSRRESASVLAYASDDAKLFPGIRNPRNWFLLHGDRDS